MSRELMMTSLIKRCAGESRVTLRRQLVDVRGHHYVLKSVPSDTAGRGRSVLCSQSLLSEKQSILGNSFMFLL